MWRTANMWEALEFMQYRKMWRRITSEFMHGGDGPVDGIEFEDHTKVVCESRFSGPYSELTPDIDLDPPMFFIFEAKKP